jgi:hypothetical protein
VVAISTRSHLRALPVAFSKGKGRGLLLSRIY